MRQKQQSPAPAYLCALVMVSLMMSTARPAHADNNISTNTFDARSDCAYGSRLLVEGAECVKGLGERQMFVGLTPFTNSDTTVLVNTQLLVAMADQIRATIPRYIRQDSFNSDTQAEIMWSVEDIFEEAEVGNWVDKFSFELNGSPRVFWSDLVEIHNVLNLLKCTMFNSAITPNICSTVFSSKSGACGISNLEYTESLSISSSEYDACAVSQSTSDGIQAGVNLVSMFGRAWGANRGNTDGYSRIYNTYGDYTLKPATNPMVASCVLEFLVARSCYSLWQFKDADAAVLQQGADATGSTNLQTAAGASATITVGYENLTTSIAWPPMAPFSLPDDGAGYGFYTWKVDSYTPRNPYATIRVDTTTGIATTNFDMYPGALLGGKMTAQFNYCTTPQQ